VPIFICDIHVSISFRYCDVFLCKRTGGNAKKISFASFYVSCCVRGFVERVFHVHELEWSGLGGVWIELTQ
jgi:hypothetical protein